MADKEYNYEFPEVRYEIGEALDLTILSDGDLKGLIEEATYLLKEREQAEKAKAAKERRAREREAAARIRALAREHGLHVSIERRRKRRRVAGKAS